MTTALSFSMDGFDMLAMGISLFEPSNALVEFNRKLHSNALYNGFQIAVNALAVFSAGAASTMKCFVAGTMILTVAGLVAIENIKAGDKVIATNPETFEVAEKTVLETYVRETTELLHLTINGEVIKTTFEHPFYVKDVGFVEAGKLQIGDRLVDSRGNVLVLEGKKLEITDKPVKVYNFKVDNFHTYHVGENRVLVHNANKYVKGTRSTVGKLTGSLDGLTSAERKVVNDLLSQGKNVEIIPRSNVQGVSTPDFIINGVKTELKTLNGTSLNTPVTRITDAFKQGADAVIIDARNVGITAEQANQILNRAAGTYQNKVLPGQVEIWTVDGIIRR